MPRVNRTSPEPSLPQPRDVSRRPSGLKLLLRRQKRFIRPVCWGVGGFGSVLAVITLLHSAQPGGTVALIRDKLASVANLRVQHIYFEGRLNTPEALLNAALGVHPGDSMLGFSLEGARQRIATLSWVESAAVERRLPGTVVVNLVERRPYAIWQNQGKFVLIDREGKVVANEDVAAFGDLPLVVGVGAPEAATTLLEALKDQPALKARFVAAVRVGERRWNLRMKNGADVMLPEDAIVPALVKLAELQASESLLDRPLAVVDMRLPGQLVIRPQSAAATSGPAITGKKA
jgi:cell division protein FtsQ